MIASDSTRTPHEISGDDDPRDVVGVLVFIVGLAAFGVVPVLSMLERLI